MLFNSLDYVFFLPLVWCLFLATTPRWRWCVLLLASYTFYMWWNVFYIVLIVASTLTDYSVGLLIRRASALRTRRLLLLFSVAANLGLLFVFKYWNFFNRSAAELAEGCGLNWNVPDLHVLLPVGISFYTFQTLSYSIDIYRGRLQPESHLGRFAVFVSFFPQLVAGPIERAERFLPQLSRPSRLDPAVLSSACVLILWGLFKKVVIADRLAIYVNAVYGNVDDHHGLSYLLATYAFAFQIYCDFSGYSDIAIGSARLFGVELMKNFDSPYFARDLQDFWRRWHISLSTWLRDYLYIPLGGNRHGNGRTYVNLMVTMLLGGLWHGASWNFVVWGGLHGGALAVLKASIRGRQAIGRWTPIPSWLKAGMQMVLTFHFVCLTWIFFRAETLHDSLTILDGIVGVWAAPFLDPLTLSHAALGLILLLGYELVQTQGQAIRKFRDRYPIVVNWVATYTLILVIVLLGAEGDSQFIYFQF